MTPGRTTSSVHRQLIHVLIAAATLFAAVPVLAQQEDQTKSQHESILLVASRAINDPNFARTVVLVMFPAETSPAGVILNRPTRLQLHEIWPDREDRKGRTDTIFFGGPVQPDGLLFLFRMPVAPQRAWRVTGDIYFSGDGDILEGLLESPNPVPGQRFFAGYAGWAYGQLEHEIARGDWHVLRVDPDVVYDTDYDTLWLRMHQRATLPRAHNVTPVVALEPVAVAPSVRDAHMLPTGMSR